MKSIRQMQKEMLSKAKFDGTYPKAVIMGLGVIALAYNDDEYKRLTKSSNLLSIFFGIGLILIWLLSLVLSVYCLYH